MVNKVKLEMEKIEIPTELHNRVLVGIEQAKKDRQTAHDKKRWGLRKKIAYFSGAAVLLGGIFVGSAFVSPATAEVASKIPFLSSVFKSKPVETVIYDELEKKGYKVSSAGLSYYPKKTVQVSLKGSDAYYHKVKKDVERIVRGIITSRGYDAYSVKVSKELVRKDYVLNEDEKKEKTTLDTAVGNKLKQLNYQFDRVQTDPTENAIFINIVGSKEYYQSVQDDVEKQALEVAEANHYKGYKIKVTRVTVEVRKSGKGGEITSTIARGLMSKKELKVTGVGYKEKPLTFLISTSVSSSDSKAKELGSEIQAMIVEFLNSKEIAPILAKEPYEIIVKSKDKKKIN